MPTLDLTGVYFCQAAEVTIISNRHFAQLRRCDRDCGTAGQLYLEGDQLAPRMAVGRKYRIRVEDVTDAEGGA